MSEETGKEIVCLRCGKKAIPERPWHKICPECFNKKLDKIASEYRARGYSVIDLRSNGVH